MPQVSFSRQSASSIVVVDINVTISMYTVPSRVDVGHEAYLCQTNRKRSAIACLNWARALRHIIGVGVYECTCIPSVSTYTYTYYALNKPVKQRFDAQQIGRT